MSEEIKHVDLEEPFKDDPEYAFFQALDGFVDQLCLAMQERGVSQSELARRLGVSRQHISAFMTDPGNPTLQTMVQMAHAVGFKVNLELTVGRMKITDVRWHKPRMQDDWRSGDAITPAKGGMAFDDIKPAA
ncbi:MAG: helix-turn-helix domain-containing protein [Armatimonadota bacterium]